MSSVFVEEGLVEVVFLVQEVVPDYIVFFGALEFDGVGTTLYVNMIVAIVQGSLVGAAL